MLVQVVPDRLLQRRHTPERPAPDPPLRERREEPLDLVEPGDAGRREVDDEPRVPQQPPLHPRGLVRAVVVPEDVDRHPVLLRDGRVDEVEEADELLLPVAAVAAADPLPVATFSAANSDVVPWRMESCVPRSAWPGPNGSSGCVRSSAWTWLFSSTLSTTARSGGFR